MKICSSINRLLITNEQVNENIVKFIGEDKINFIFGDMKKSKIILKGTVIIK